MFQQCGHRSERFVVPHSEGNQCLCRYEPNALAISLRIYELNDACQPPLIHAYRGGRLTVELDGGGNVACQARRGTKE